MTLRLDSSYLDKNLPVPVGVQLRGLLAYIISHDDLAYGTRLPSVRQLADDLGLAPMTVNQVYQELRDAGLIEIRRGAGAFVARDPERVLSHVSAGVSLRQRVDALIDEATALGIGSAQLMTIVNAQIQFRRRNGLNLMFVGIFEGPTRDYVADLRPFCGPEDRLEITTQAVLAASAAEREKCLEADMVFTFVHRVAEVRQLVPGAEVFGIRFIPSQATRLALAAIDPRQRVAAVTRFQEYIAIMRPSIQQFAPHVSDIHVTYLDATDIGEVVASRDVVVYATGADAIQNLAPSGARCIEYRHSPDPAELQRLLLPLLAELRAAKAQDREEEAPDTGAAPLAATA